ncbi:MAG: PorV/PorQ family protein [Elusimicrobia bacterium]|nr:PorV/PorQ family protein [Elusimicrobiota bacterium]
MKRISQIRRRRMLRMGTAGLNVVGVGGGLGLGGGVKILLGLILLLPTTLWAAGVGTTAAQFLKIGVGARALALGGAYVAVADDAHALYWNPAGAAHLKSPELAASYNNLYQDTSQGYIGYVQPRGKAAWGGAVDYLQVAKIEARQGDTASPDYNFTARDTAVLGSYAYADILPQLSLGLSLKYLQLHLDSKHARAFAVDLGSLYKVRGAPLTLGVAVLNVGSKVKFDSESDPLPLGIKAGIAYRLWGEKLLIATGVDSWIRDKRTFGQLGMEWKPLALLAIRAGYQLGHGQDQLGGKKIGLGGGAGFHLKMVNVDYAFVPFGDLGDTHRFSLGLKF